MKWYWREDCQTNPKTVYFILLMAIWAGVVIAVANMKFVPENRVLYPVLAIFSLVLMWASIFEYVGFKTARRTVCMALAGLELGIYHCADDLVIRGDVPRPIADKIIDGEYDDLLRDPLTCRYIG